MKEKIWQYLPHCIYTEWLTWSDLSALDIACLGDEDREEWLSSLSSVVIAEQYASSHETQRQLYELPNEKLVNYYEWLHSRKVFVKHGFPIRLSVLEDLLRCCCCCCDGVTSFCSTLHSIVILDENNDDTTVVHYDASRIESFLSSFLHHCNHLEEVRIRKMMPEMEMEPHNVEAIVYTALNNQLQDNQLVKIEFHIDNNDNKVIHDKRESLLLKHINSLKEVKVIDQTEDYDCSGMILLLKTLIKSKHTLRVLDIDISKEEMFTSPIPLLLLDYLSTTGKLLEKLNFDYSGDNAILTNEWLTLIGTSCPNLEILFWNIEGDDDSLKPIVIYQLCPNLKRIGISGLTIRDAEDDKTFLEVRLFFNWSHMSLIDIMECVLLSLQRGQYKELGLFVHNRLEVGVDVISKIGSELTCLEAPLSEDVLINVLPKLPRLQELDVQAVGRMTNRSLAALSEHGETLIELSFSKNIFIKSEFEFTDEMISQVIRNCKMLEVLEIPCAGCESILSAAQHLIRLKILKLPHVTASKADIISLMSEGGVTWLSYCLIKGNIGDIFKYNRSCRSWVAVADRR